MASEQSRPPSLWDKIDYSLIVVPGAPEVSEQQVKQAEGQARAWKRLRPVLDTLGVLFWTYVILQVFFFDVDRAVLGSYANYRFFLFAAIGVVLAVTIKRTWPILGAFAYILGFPLVVACWKVPKTLYRARSPVVFLAVANAVTSAFSELRRSIVVGGIVLFAALAVAVSHSTVLLGAAGGALAVLVLSAIYRTVRASLVPNRFLQVQQRTIRKALSAKIVRGLMEPGDELRNPAIEKFNAGQQQTLVSNLGNAVISHRLLIFWAYQLDRYRRSPASIVLTALTYLWLLVRAVVGLTFINIAIYHADAHAFTFETRPTVLTFVHYVIAGLYANEIRGLAPVSELANAVSIATFVIGLVVLGSALLSSVLSYRASRDESEIKAIIGQIRDESDQLDERVRENFEVSVPEATKRLEELKFGLMGVITALSTRIPTDFDRRTQ